MSDYHSITQDAYPSMSEVNELLSVQEIKPDIKDLPEICEHKECEQGERYFGRDFKVDYYYYWFCSDCGEEVESEPDET